MIKIYSPFITQFAYQSKFPFVGLQKWRKGKAVWPFVFFSERNPSRQLIEHEKIHLRQQLKGLIIFFYIKYYYYQIRYGYDKNPYEIEAYAHQDDYLKDE